MMNSCRLMEFITSWSHCRCSDIELLEVHHIFVYKNYKGQVALEGNFGFFLDKSSGEIGQ